MVERQVKTKRHPTLAAEHKDISERNVKIPLYKITNGTHVLYYIKYIVRLFLKKERKM